MTTENNLMTVDNVPNVEIAKKQWDKQLPRTMETLKKMADRI